MPTWDAIVLTGGRGSRLGGVDKSQLRLGEETLLERTLRNVSAASRVILVGDASRPGTITVREEPRHGGPAAAVAAGLVEVRSPAVLLLACDQPFAAEAIEKLLTTFGDDDGLIAVDSGGHRQPLLSLVDSEALRASVSTFDDLDGLPLRTLLARLQLREIRVTSRSAMDIDTWDDHRIAQARAMKADTGEKAGSEWHNG